MQQSKAGGFAVRKPEEFNEAWARAFNTRDVDNILSLYEDDAILVAGEAGVRGKAQIAQELSKLLAIPGQIVGRNNFCLVHGDLALLRADWKLLDPAGAVMMSGGSAEIIRRQGDGRWLYVIDHAAGASVPPAV